MAFLYRFLSLILPTAFLILTCQEVKATHVVGGDLCYKLLAYDTANGANFFQYEVSLTLYRDCDGVPHEAIVYIGVYDSAGNHLLGTLGIDIPYPDPGTPGAEENLPNETYNLCLFSPPEVCYTKTEFVKTVSLPARPGGYQLVYQRCCRNGTIININNPLGNGASWVLDLPDPFEVGFNSSPCFNEWPPTIICLNGEVNFDHSATDPDGDSLAYKLCWATLSSLVVVDAGSPPPDPLPIFGNVQYLGGYSYLDPLGNPADPLLIDVNTGHLTGKAAQQGQFVVAVCVEEWRDGQLLSTNKRDFQFNVALCDTDATAGYIFNIDTCLNHVSFTNTSFRATSFLWDFGIDSLDNDTSILENASYEYTDTGTYNIRLIVNPYTTCADTIDNPVHIATGPLVADFSVTDVCDGDPVRFTNLSTSGSGSGVINSWFWTLGENDVASVENPPDKVYAGPGTYPITLTVQTDKGCTDTIAGGGSKEVEVFQLPEIEILPNQTIVLGDSVQLASTGGFITYDWTPGTALSDSTIRDPIANPVVTTEYELAIMDSNNCVAKTEVTVEVIIPADIEAPTAFTPNGDGLNDIFYVYDLLGYDGVGLETFNLKIFNRWGELVYESDDIMQGWDGKHFKNRKEMEVGVYVYVVNATKRTGETIPTIFRNVSLIR